MLWSEIKQMWQEVGGRVTRDHLLIRGVGPFNGVQGWHIRCHLVGKVKMFCLEGFTKYIHQWWNWLDFVMVCLYLCTISIRFVWSAGDRRDFSISPAGPVPI